jgi:opacity protein-like surface antigen
MKKRIAACGAILALLSGPVAAQILQNEISFFGSLDDIQEPTDFELSIFNLRYGRYLSPQAVATLGISRTRFNAGAADVKTMALTIGAKYYFGQQRVSAFLPFAEAAIGVANSDSGAGSSTDLTWEFGGGASYFFTEATSFDGSIRWYQTDTEAKTQGIKLFLGLTTRF